MENTLEYKGYYAKIEYNAKDEVFFGSIEAISDSISFEGVSAVELKTSFQSAVEDYLDMCKRHGKEPKKNSKPQA